MAEQTADAKAAAEAKAAEDQAKQEAKAAAAAPTYRVTGAAVVLRADDKTERYLYRGATVDASAFSEDSIKHALSVGLIEKIK